LFDFVVKVDFINTFKTRLHTYWSNQDVAFDWAYTAALAGILDRSE